MSIPQKSMMIISSQRGEFPTFRMIPLTIDCPFAEIVYVPDARALQILYKHAVEGLHMMPKLDDNGQPVPNPKAPKGTNPYKQERKTLTVPQDAYIYNPTEIEEFVQMFAVNDKFNYKIFMEEPKAPIIETPEIPKLILPS